MKLFTKIGFVLSLVCVLALPRLSQAATWNAVVDDTFSRADTSTGGAGTTTGVGNSWTDTAGGMWNISSNTLQGTSAVSSDYLTKFLTRPAAEDSKDQRIVATIPSGENFNGQFLGLVLRYQSSTNNHYLAHISSSGIYLYKIVGGATTLISSSLVSLTSTHSYSVDFSTLGSSSTALSVVVTDLTTATEVGTISATDSESSLQGTGSAALSTWYNSGVHAIHASRVQTFTTNFVLTGTASLAGAVGTPIAINTLQILGTSTSSTPVKLRVTSGVLAMSTTTGLTFTGSSTGTTLYFSGTVANLNAALATLTYTRGGAGSDTLEVSLVNSGEVFFSDNGHLYKFISGSTTWTTARTAATSQVSYGTNGYLATITSQAENDFVAARLVGDGWFGASDSASEGDWKWVTGPETGTSFWSGAAGGSVVSSRYANWAIGEPNDSSSNEDCAQFYVTTGKWNDLPCSGTTLSGYVAEFGSAGNMPTVVAMNIAITTSLSYTLSYSAGSHGTLSGTTSQLIASGANGSAVTAVPAAGYSFVNWSDASTANPRTDTSVSGNVTVTANFADVTAPAVPSAPTTTSPTNNAFPAWTWSVPTELGSGIEYYLVKWSQNADCSGFGNSDASTNSYTMGQYDEFADGTWYFCVAARDYDDNTSDFSSSGSVIVDTVAPVVTGISILPAQTNASISWVTDEASSSSIVYGITNSYGSDTGETDLSPRVISHGAYIYNLTCGTTYYYRISSSDRVSNTGRSASDTFTTLACPRSNVGGAVTPVAIKTTPVSFPPNLDFTVTRVQKTAGVPVVSLSMNADPAYVRGYALSLDPTFKNEGIRPYTGTSATVTLPGSGTYKVYLKYYSSTGQASDVIVRTVTAEADAAQPSRVAQSSTVFSRTLRAGVSGADVSALQKVLVAEGLLDMQGSSYGYFGRLTQASVGAFQLRYNIVAKNDAGYGIFGPKTRIQVTLLTSGA